MPVTVPSGLPAGSTTAGTVGTYSAPVAVTRRFRFPVSSYLNPVECASLATAVCIPRAPALTLNWISPLLPLQTEAQGLGLGRGHAAVSRTDPPAWADQEARATTCVESRKSGMLPLDCRWAFLSSSPLALWPFSLYLQKRRTHPGFFFFFFFNSRV